MKHTLYTLLFFSLSLQAFSQDKSSSIAGVVRSESNGLALAGANVLVLGTNVGAATNGDGQFLITGLSSGSYELRITSLGYRPEFRTVTVREGEPAKIEVILSSAPIQFPDVEIIGSAPSALQRIPGSGTIIPSAVLAQSHPISTNEVLRKVPGIFIREEDGFGIRPNIGIRGLFPTRSTKVLLLEDGVPFSIAPYGDPASYYHPPVHRFNRIEVLKGSGQILFGPQTIGGVINYITPQPPSSPTGSIKVMSGNRDFLYGQLNYGGRWNGIGVLADYSRKQGLLARENSSTTVQDINAKVSYQPSVASSLSLKLNLYDEASNVTYAGLTTIEYEENPFQNQFKDDWLYFQRFGSHLVYDHALNDGLFLLTTNVYGYYITRDWWRQGNNSGTNSTNPGNAPGVRTVLNPTRNDGRNREYTVFGIDPRIRMNHSSFGLRQETDFGMRAHFEEQKRLQIEGNGPTAREGILREDNLRKTQAFSVFVQDRVFFTDNLILSGGVRLENVNYTRTNNLNGATGDAKLTELIPGIGISYNPTQSMTLFAGVHRGFAPPRVEDVISNSDGSSIDLDAEKSWSYEVGVRSSWFDRLFVDLTVFQMDFENQIIPASLAGGSGTTLTNAGQTMHRGVELKSVYEIPFGSTTATMSDELNDGVTLDLAFTYLPEAKYEGARASVINPAVSVTGNRLPYSPENTLTFGVKYANPIGLDLRVEVVRIADQFADDLNTIEPTPNGRQGLLPASTVWNLTANYLIKPFGLTVFSSLKNATNEVFIVDRSRGILPSMPRLIQLGARWDF